MTKDVFKSRWNYEKLLKQRILTKRTKSTLGLASNCFQEQRSKLSFKQQNQTAFAFANVLVKNRKARYEQKPIS